MRAALRGFYSSDIEALETHRPDDPECFQIGVTAFIGPAEGGFGEEMFDFTVCTANWLQQHPPPKNFEFLRSTILMERWDYATLSRALGDLCLHAEGKDWPEIAAKLSRYGHWEFEDHRKPG
jgi:hypothetical protein